LIPAAALGAPPLDLTTAPAKLASGKPLSRGNRGNNADAYLKRNATRRVARDGPPSEAVVVAVTEGRLDGSTELTEVFGPWEQIFYGEFGERRRKRVLVKIIGEEHPHQPTPVAICDMCDYDPISQELALLTQLLQ
jgi:hypothetical protein